LLREHRPPLKGEVGCRAARSGPGLRRTKITTAALAIQKAIYAALTADAGAGALIGDRIYDVAPRDAVFPYATIGKATQSDWSTGTEEGAEHRLTLDVWSRAHGKSECHAIAEAIRLALHDAALALEGHALVNLRFESADVARDPDGLTFHGVLRFRAVTEANSE
jgi:hypothetical protein